MLCIKADATRLDRVKLCVRHEAVLVEHDVAASCGFHFNWDKFALPGFGPLNFFPALFTASSFLPELLWLVPVLVVYDFIQLAHGFAVFVYYEPAAFADPEQHR